MAASPPDLVQQVSKVRPDWDVVLPRPELIVEMLIIARILLQYHAVSCQQVRKSVRSHGAIHVNLVFVLGMDQWGKHKSVRITILKPCYAVSIRTCYLVDELRTQPHWPWRSQKMKHVWPMVRRGSRRVWKRRSWWRPRRSCRGELWRAWRAPGVPDGCPGPSRRLWHFSLPTVGLCWPAPTSCPGWLWKSTKMLKTRGAGVHYVIILYWIFYLPMVSRTDSVRS